MRRHIGKLVGARHPVPSSASLVPCARVFALARERSSWKLDPTTLPRGFWRAHWAAASPRGFRRARRPVGPLAPCCSARPSRPRFRARARMVKCVGGSRRSSPDSRFRARARMVKRKARPYGFAVSPPACPSTGSPAPLAPRARVLRFVRGGRAKSSTLRSCWGSPAPHPRSALVSGGKVNTSADVWNGRAGSRTMKPWTTFL